MIANITRSLMRDLMFHAAERPGNPGFASVHFGMLDDADETANEDRDPWDIATSMRDGLVGWAEQGAAIVKRLEQIQALALGDQHALEQPATDETVKHYVALATLAMDEMIGDSYGEPKPDEGLNLGGYLFNAIGYTKRIVSDSRDLAKGFDGLATFIRHCCPNSLCDMETEDAPTVMRAWISGATVEAWCDEAQSELRVQATHPCHKLPAEVVVREDVTDPALPDSGCLVANVMANDSIDSALHRLPLLKLAKRVTVEEALATTAPKAEVDLQFVMYTDCNDGGCDTAFALFQYEQQYVLAYAGPGFDAEGENKRGYAWGGAFVLEDPSVIPVNLAEHKEAQDRAAGDFYGPFPEDAWEDMNRVLSILRSLAEQEVLFNAEG